MAKAAELRELPDEELLDRLEGFKEELFNLRFQLATGQLDNPMRIKTVRHDVARILTVLRGRHLEQELEEEVARADEVALERARHERGRPHAEPAPGKDDQKVTPAGAQDDDVDAESAHMADDDADLEDSEARDENEAGEAG